MSYLGVCTGKTITNQCGPTYPNTMQGVCTGKTITNQCGPYPNAPFVTSNTNHMVTGEWQFQEGKEGLLHYELDGDRRKVPADRRNVVEDMTAAVYSHIGQLKCEIDNNRFITNASLSRCLRKDGSLSELYLVTCAHNIVFRNPFRNKLDGITGGTFYWGQGKTPLKLKKWAHYPKYTNKSSTYSGYNYAIATIEQPQKQPPSSGYFVSHSSFLKEVTKGGSKLRLSGYAGDSKSLSEKMFSMEGSVNKVFHEVDKEHGIIIYTNIDTTRGQSGAPLFAIPPFTAQVTATIPTATSQVDNIVGIRCGIHVGTHSRYNYATMETKAIATWRCKKLKEWGVV